MPFLKKIISFVCYKFFPTFSQKGAILMYHSVGHNKKFTTATPEMFERQLAYLKKNNYCVISLKEMIERTKAGGDLSGTVALTFDDGYLDFYTTVFPLLQQYQFPATLFVPTGVIGKALTVSRGADTFPIVNEVQIKEMIASGLVDVMPHSVNHLKLHSLTFEAAIKEIEDSRIQLEKITGNIANIFAYPSGRYTAEIVSHLRESGSWLGAVSVESGLVSHTQDLFLLPRNSIDSGVGSAEFKMKVTDAIVLYNKIRLWVKH